MQIEAIVFDIGGVLEITPPTGWEKGWEDALSLQPGELNKRLRNIWIAGSLDKISEAEVEKGISETLGLDNEQVAAFMRDLWTEYLGTLNRDLAIYFTGLRPRYKTGIISNSFAGAREKEQERYGFGDMCDLIIYSHEEGIKKPDPRIYMLACERLDVRPREMIFLDDVPEAVNAARELGINAILFKDTQQAIADIETLLGPA